MTLEEKVHAIDNIERVLDDYSSYFVDWELLYNDKQYRPEFPPNLIKARKNLIQIAEILGAAQAKQQL